MAVFLAFGNAKDIEAADTTPLPVPPASVLPLYIGGLFGSSSSSSDAPLPRAPAATTDLRPAAAPRPEQPVINPLEALAPYLPRPGEWRQVPSLQFDRFRLTDQEANALNLRGTGGSSAVLSQQTGSAYDPEGFLWYFWGGGGDVYGGNEVYRLDLTLPLVTQLTQPSVLDATVQVPGSVNCFAPSDGPAAASTFDGFVWSPGTQSFFVFPTGGFCPSGVYNQDTIWEFDPLAGTWDSVAGMIGLVGPVFAEYDPVSDRIYVVEAGANATLRDFDPVTGQLGARVSLGQTLSVGNAVLDSATDEMFIFAQEGVFAISLSSPGTINRLADVPSGFDTASGAAFDTRSGVIALWDGGKNIRSFDTATNQWTEETAPSGPTAGPGGVFSKWVAIKEFGIFAGYHNPAEGLWLYRLPTTLAVPAPVNRAPIAFVGNSVITAHTGDVVNLDGSGSTDPDGDTLTYAWSTVSSPAGNSPSLSTPTQATTSFTPAVNGGYVIRLTVSDGALSDTATVTLTAGNAVPVANAGADQSIQVGQTAFLNAGGSSDADGDTLSYSWSLTAKPSGSSATLSGAQSVSPSFVADTAGTYRLSVTVNDGIASASPSDTVEVSATTAPPTNNAPVAKAGPDQTLIEGQTASLDGLQSSDLDGDALSYAWTLTARPTGSNATLSDATAAQPTVLLDVPGDYLVDLAVSDGQLTSATDQVKITANIDLGTAGGDQNIIAANPSNYKTLMAGLKPGDTLLLAPGTYTNGMTLPSLHGEPGKPIIISGPEDRSAIILARSCCNTVELSSASYLEIRNLTLDGLNNGGSHAVNSSGPTNNITIENLEIINHGSNRQIVGINTKAPAWDWVIRNNIIRGAGTGIYLGRSNGEGPFVRGLIEGNLIVDTVGYNMEIKHQNPRPSLAGMPTGKSSTTIRYNVFSKANQPSNIGSSGERPNVLVGHMPLSGVGTEDQYRIYGNLFYQNLVGEALFQGEGNVALYDNLFVNNDGDAIWIQPHNDKPKMIRIFNNTVVARDRGIRVTGGDSLFTQNVVGNAVFATTPIQASDQSDNLTDGFAAAGAYVNDPTGAPGTLDLYPRAGALQTYAIDLSQYAEFSDYDKDFNGDTRDGTYRGAYAGEGANPGWQLQFATRPVPGTPPGNSGGGTPTNAAPVANAGADQTLDVGQTATLDGSGSFDSDGDTLTYVWELVSQPAASTGNLSNISAQSPTLPLDAPGDYVASLVVQDGLTISAEDTVTITAVGVAPDPDPDPDPGTGGGSADCGAGNSSAPYPQSTEFCDIQWDFGSIVTLAPGSDNWPITWSDDDNQYTIWGDGGGFGGTNSLGRVSLGFARVEGTADSYTGFNVWGGNNAPNSAQFGGKSYGIISIGGVLYAWLGTASNGAAASQSFTRETYVIRSDDKGATWFRPSQPMFRSSDNLYGPSFLNYGKDNAGAGAYVYSYFPRGNNWQLQVPGIADLARVPTAQIMDKAAYEWFAGLDSLGNPTWTSDMTARQVVFQDANGLRTVSVTYNPGLNRYFLTNQHSKVGSSSDTNKFGVFVSENPWGPWETVAYETNWEGGRGNISFYFAPKWWSADGLDFTMVYTNADSWGTIRGTFATGTGTGSGTGTGGGTGGGSGTGSDPTDPSSQSAYWAFEEGTGLIASDDSGNVNNATLVGVPAWVSGKVGTALEFDGNGDYLQVPSGGNLDNLSSFTYSAWIYPTADGDREILSKSGSNRELRLMQTGAALTLRGCVVLSAASACSDAVGGSIALNTWQFVTMRYEDTGSRRVHLFIDGAEVSYASQSVGSGAVSSDSGSALNIGRRSVGDRQFQGMIDEFRVFDRALDITEIQGLMDNLVPAGGGSGTGGSGGSGTGGSGGSGTVPDPGDLSLLGQLLPNAGAWSLVPNTEWDVVGTSTSEAQALNVQGTSGSKCAITAWNGMAYDSDNHIMYLYGGGHNCYGGNEVYSIDLETLAFERRMAPEPLVAGSCAQPSTGPAATHTYNGFVFSPATGTAFQFSNMGFSGEGCSLWGNWIAEFDPASNSWTRLSGFDEGVRYPGAVWDPIGQQFLVMGGRDDKWWRMYDPVARSWKTGQGPRTPWLSTGDAINYEGEVYFQHSDSLYKSAIALTDPSEWTKVTDYPSGLEFEAGFDVTADGRFVFWDGDSDIWVYDPDRDAWQRMSNSSGPSGEGKVYSKWVYIPELDAFAGYNNPSEGLWLYRLPGSNTPPPPPPPPTPTLSFSVSPTSITEGQSANLSWSSTDTTACTAGGGWSGTKSPNGSESVAPAATTNYALTCTGSGGSVTDNFSLTVTSAGSTNPGGGTGGTGGTVTEVLVPLTIEELVPSGATAIARSNEPASFGVPLLDEYGVTSVDQLGLSGATAAQFRALETYPSGNVKWVLVDTLASIAAGGNVSVELGTGSGNFGGGDLAVDTGATIEVDTGSGQFSIRKAGFNIVDRATVGGRTLVQPGHAGGLVYTDDLGVEFSSLYDNPTVTIFENGPVKAVVKAEGRFKSSIGTTAPMGYTVYITFYKNLGSVKLGVSLRNAYEATYASLPFKSLELKLPTQLASGKNFSFPTSGTTYTGNIAAGQSAYVYQGATRRNGGGPYFNSFFAQQVPDLIGAGDVGTRVVNGGSVIKSFSGNEDDDYALGWASVQDSAGSGVTVVYKNMEAYFPASIEFSDSGLISIGIFSKYNSLPSIIMDWATHESRDLLLDFSTAPADGELVNARLQMPLFGRASLDHYRMTGAFFGEKRLASYDDQLTLYNTANAYNGGFVYAGRRQKSDFALSNSRKEVVRKWNTSAGGSENQRDYIVSQMLDYVRIGSGGQMLNALQASLYKSDQFAWRSDDFDFGTKSRNYHDEYDESRDSFNGVETRNKHERDIEHIWVYGMYMAYYFTGDERIKLGLIDLAESTYTMYATRSIEEFSFKRSGASAARIALLSYLFTREQRYLDELNERVFDFVDVVSRSPNQLGFGRNDERGYVYSKYYSCDFRQYATTFTSTGPASSPRVAPLITTTYIASTYTDILRFLPDSQVFSNPEKPGVTYTKEDLRDALEGLSYFMVKEMMEYPTDITKQPYTYHSYLPDCPFPLNQSSARTWDPGNAAAMGYEFTGDTDFLTKGIRQLIWVDDDQDTSVNSDLGALRLAYDATYPGETVVGNIPLTVVDNGGGSYTLSWTVPAGSAVRYQLKHAGKQIVPNLNYEKVSMTYEFDPSQYTPFWGAKNIDGEPLADAGGLTQTMNVSGLSCGSTCFFGLRYRADGT